ncbi:MAG: ferritin-like domain-containing protein [Minicystis sp.]
MKRARPASERVRDEWLRRVEAEYRSAALAQHLGLWLLQIGASPDLVRTSQRVVRDELVHASQARRVHAAAGGSGAPVLERSGLGLSRRPADALELDVARACVEVLCLGETVAVPLFAALRAGCSIPVARAALDRVLRDEVRHRDLGWDLLAWLLALPSGGEIRRTVEAELPAMLARLVACYAAPETRARDDVDADDRAWGLMPGERYAAVLTRSIARDHLPRFARLGIDARAAWASAAP